MFSIRQKFLHTVRNKIKKESCQLVERKKSYSKSNFFLKMPKKLKIFSLKIHEGTGIFSKPKNLSE